MFKILVVEDDLDLRNLFCKSLKRDQYNAHGAGSAPEALDMLENEHFDLVVTDVMMPDMDGFEFVRRLREARMDMPVLFITAKGDISDKQRAFFAGGDDYMVKPIDIHEMMLRINALLRRAKSVSEKKLHFGNTLLEYETWTVTDANGTLVLPQKEFQLLYKLISYPGQIFTRQQILSDIWGLEEVDPHTLDVHISRLRDRFRNNPDFEIVTIRGLGYRVMKK